MKPAVQWRYNCHVDDNSGPTRCSDELRFATEPNKLGTSAINFVNPAVSQTPVPRRIWSTSSNSRKIHIIRLSDGSDRRQANSSTADSHSSCLSKDRNLGSIGETVPRLPAFRERWGIKGPWGISGELSQRLWFPDFGTPPSSERQLWIRWTQNM